MEALAKKLESWIKEQVYEANCKGLVVGLSGGVDSSTVAVLCKRAFPQSVLGVIMPCYSSQRDLEHAQAVAERFDIPVATVDLGAAFDSLLKALPAQGSDASGQQLAAANLKPRLRMVTLYYLANQLRYLVVGTGNKSELAVGYFTKYGDGGVDILPLGNLVKRQVRELASHLGIPREIIEKTPSADLWPGQTDEGEMGLTYEELDRYLTKGEASEELKKRIDSMARASAHKRRPPPIPSF